MSHDLVPLRIAAQNMTPNVPSLDSTPLFQAALNYIQSHPVQTLTVDTGNYYLLSATQGNAVVIGGNLANLTIDLAGSNIFFKGPQLPNGIQLFYCTNVTLNRQSSRHCSALAASDTQGAVVMIGSHRRQSAKPAQPGYGFTMVSTRRR